MLTLKKAQSDDAKFVYTLRFSPDVIETSLSSTVPTLEQHLAWWSKAETSGTHPILIAFIGDKKVGYVRYDLSDSFAEVSIAIEQSERGKGLGKIMLQQGEEWLKKNTKTTCVRAKVLQHNTNSQKMFKSQGFVETFVQFEKVIK